MLPHYVRSESSPVFLRRTHEQTQTGSRITTESTTREQTRTSSASNALLESAREHARTARIRSRRMASRGTEGDSHSHLRLPAVPIPWLLLLLLLNLISCARAAIHTYSGQRAYYSADLLLYRAGREGMFANERGASPGSGYIRCVRSAALSLPRPSSPSARSCFPSP
ncbi:unnamed protein product [Closterium sp. NIES-54]